MGSFTSDFIGDLWNTDYLLVIFLIIGILIAYLIYKKGFLGISVPVFRQDESIEVTFEVQEDGTIHIIGERKIE